MRRQGRGGATSPKELRAGGPASPSIPGPAPSPRPYQLHVLTINSNSLQSQSLNRPGSRAQSPGQIQGLPQDAHGREKPVGGQGAPVPGKSWHSSSRTLPCVSAPNLCTLTGSASLILLRRTSGVSKANGPTSSREERKPCHHCAHAHIHCSAG